MTAPDGREWTVRRRWVPDWASVQWRGAGDRLGNAADVLGVGFDDAGGLLLALAFGVLLVLVLLVAWPVVALAVELLILLFVFLGALAGRVVLRRPWRLEAEPRHGPGTHVRHVRGWRASRRALAEMEAAIVAGRAR